MVLRNATRMTDVGTLSHPAAQAARNLAIRFVLGLHTVQEKMAATMSEIEIAYAGSILSSGRHAGERLAPAEGPATICGLFVETDDTTGLALRVEPVRTGGRLSQVMPI